MKLATTYYHFKYSKSRIQVHQGGTRSGKTYSILLGLVELCHKNENAGATITICRKTLPSLRGSAMRDFFEILQREEIYNPDLHNKSEATYRLFGNLVEFISIDQPQKVRGRKRNVLFVNEANELNIEDWRQLLLRTTGRIIIDYNPSDEFHWIYDDVIPRDDADFFQTTYRDNPFLPEEVVVEIERLKDADPEYWKVYGLGERASLKNAVFGHWQEVQQIPQGFKPWCYAIDFGFVNDPTAIVGVYTDGHGFCFDELCYSTNMTNSDIVNTLHSIGVNRRTQVIADSAEPKSIEEIKRRGFNCKPCRKGPDSVRSGVDFLRSRPFLVTGRSVNGIKELKNYRWQLDKNGKALNTPIDLHNHFIDAARYGATNRQRLENLGQYKIG